MGQRLVITLKDSGKDLAKIYYHWSAYSVSAIQEAKSLLDNLDSTGFFEAKDENQKILSIIRAVEMNGGGLNQSSDELAYLSKILPDETFKTEGYSRNNGLVAFTEEGMEDLQGWSEGDLTIDFDSGMVYNAVFSYLSEDELVDWYDMTDSSIVKIPEFSIDISEFKIADIDEVEDSLLNELPDIYKFGEEYIGLIA